jgi:predicted lactoylglutathione lyase
MPRMIFVNLPVTDLARSVAFYEAVGGVKNPMFSDDTAACMVFSDTIHTMLLTHNRWRDFTDRQIPDAHQSAQVFVCLSEDSRDSVDSVVTSAARSGGTADPNTVQDYGFMYCRSYADPDGHIWEVMWMDPEAAAQGPESFASHMGGG